MLSFSSFNGINNVLPQHRVPNSGLHAAVNVDVGLSGELTRRDGYSLVSHLCHKNLWQANGFLLATSGSELVAVHPDGARHVIHPALGPERIWYCNLPDGRTTYTNGLLHGVTDGFVGLDRSVPAVPVDPPPELTETAGGLFKGAYRVYLTYRRDADGAEGPASDLRPATLAQGGLVLTALPALAGHTIQVYLGGLDGEGAYLAGAAPGETFRFAGYNRDLVLPCRSLGAVSVPVGTYTAVWRGRVVAAVGETLWAARAAAPHLADWRDFRPMKSKITGVVAVTNGLYVGTEGELVFLGGDTFDGLQYQDTARGAVVAGSMVPAPGHRLKLGDGAGNGEAMVCLAGGRVVAGFAGGTTNELTGGAYATAVTEVAATFRELNGIPQYVAIPQ